MSGAVQSEIKVVMDKARRSLASARHSLAGGFDRGREVPVGCLREHPFLMQEGVGGVTGELEVVAKCDHLGRVIEVRKGGIT